MCRVAVGHSTSESRERTKIKAFVKRFDTGRDALREGFRKNPPESYGAIVKAVVSILADEGSYEPAPDPERITQIDHGNYQGSLIFVIGASGHQPGDYWAVKVYYGSCSGCDTLQKIRADDWEDDEKGPSEKALDGYMTLALHVVQGMKEIFSC
jgi:hypothetical protein